MYEAPFFILGQKGVIESYGPLLSAGAVIISALLAWRVALYNIKAQRRINKRRATLELISRREWDGDYLKSRAEFNKLKNAQGLGLEFWAQRAHWDSPQMNTIRAILNDYELVAIGISEGDLDDILYHQWYKSSFIKDYDIAKTAIARLRRETGTPTLFVAFEAVALRWKTGAGHRDDENIWTRWRSSRKRRVA